MTSVDELINSLSQLALQTNENINSHPNNNMPNPEVPLFDTRDLQIIPEFDGDVQHLHEFLRIANQLVNYYSHPDRDNFQNFRVLNGVLSKITGRAKIAINNRRAKTWAEIKQTLTDNFADQRSEDLLVRDLLLLKQKPNQTYIAFFDECNNLLDTIINYIEINDGDEEKRIKHSLYTRFTLTTFLRGLREPMGKFVRSNRPDTILKALEIIKEEEKLFQTSSVDAQLTYLKSRNRTQHTPNTQHTQKQNFNHTQTQNQNPFYKPVQKQYTQFYRPTQQFGNSPLLAPNRINIPNNNNYNMNRNPPNAFKPTQNNTNTYKPTPMSTSTIYTTPQFKNYNIETNDNEFENPEIDNFETDLTDPYITSHDEFENLDELNFMEDASNQPTT